MATVTTKGILKIAGKILGVILLFYAFALLALLLIPIPFNLLFMTGITAIIVIAIYIHYRNRITQDEFVKLRQGQSPKI
jgi:predicted membrane chloride channel (bestrophin family)